MENALAGLERAKAIIVAAIQSCNQGSSGNPTPTETAGPGQVPDTNPNSGPGVTNTSPTYPPPSGPNPDINTSSSGINSTIAENEIISGGDQDNGEDMIDRVEVYEYDLGQYGDAVTSIDMSGVPGDAQLNLIGWDASGNAIVAIGDDGLIITVEASASAYLAELQYGASVGPLSLDVEALIGARADVSADFKINPMEGDFEVELQGGVVVGASINANGELDLKYMAVEAGATGVAGFAAEGHLEVGLDDWEFEFDAGGKLAFLLGGGVDVSFSVDGKEIVMTMADGASVVWDTAGNVLQGLDNIIPGDGIPLIPGI